jgi:TolB-like protein/DNA-binding SARP family transcriptional activator
MMYSLKLFGGPSLMGEQGVLGGRAVRGHRLALLSLLAVADAQPITRDKLIALLWPDSDTGRARHLLSQSLYLLRQSLGDDAVPTAGDGVRLNPERIRSDVQELAEALGSEDYKRAVALYRGPLLDGFFLADTPEFERWLDAERERFARRYAQALEALAERSETRGEFTAAVEWWRSLAVHDPYSGRVALRLLQALEAAGDRTAALRHARVHELLLREDVDAEVDPAVTAFVERLLTEPPRQVAAAVEATTRAAGGENLTGYDPPASLGAALSAPDPPSATIQREAPAPAKRSFPRHSVWWAAVAACLVLAVTVSFAVQRQTSGETPPHALAVLPFADLSGDPANAYFADGVHEDLLANLSGIASLRIISRTSVMPYRKAEKNLRQIAQELGVNFVVEGSVRRESGRVLITAQLIDALTDHHLWAEQYHRDPADIFAVQGEIAQRIAGALQLKLTPEEQRRIGKAPTGTLTVYDLYLQGLDYVRRYRAEDVEIAVGLFERAIEADPQFALAHARLSSAYALKAALYRQGPEWADSALSSAQRAVALDPRLAEAHHALGTSYIAQGEHRKARPALERAISLNPAFAGPVTNLAAVLSRTGEYDQAIAWLRRSAELDPRGVMTLASLSRAYAILGLFPEAEETMGRALTLRPDLPLAARQHAVLLAALQAQHVRAIQESDLLVSAHPEDPLAWTIAGDVRLLAGETHAAREYLERAYSLSPMAAWRAPVRVLLGYTYLATGEPERGRKLLREEIEYARGELANGNGQGSLRYGLAAAYAVLGDKRQANRWLRALVEDGAGLDRFRHDPLLENLRGDPEFERTRGVANARLDAMRRLVEREST